MNHKDFISQFDLPFFTIGAVEKQFNYDIIPEFFSHFDYALIQHGNCQITVSATRQNKRLYHLNIHATGTIQLTCDRCLNTFNYPIDATDPYILKIVSTEPLVPREDGIFYALEDDEHINLAEAILELIQFQIPIKKLCKMGGQECDPVMIERISKFLINKEQLTDSHRENLV